MSDAEQTSDPEPVPTAEPEPIDAPKRSFPLVTAIVALTFVGLGVGYVLMNNTGTKAPTEASAKAQTVTPGELYYVFAETVEFAPLGLEGDTWDLDDSAPDIGYEIAWKGQTVFESTEVGDALIGRWSGMKIGLGEAVSLLKKGKADPGQIIDAALMRAEPGGRFVISFHDGDLTGNDAAGNFTVPWEGLLVGSHVLEGPTQGRGFIRATLRIIPSSGDLFKVLKSLSSDPR